MSAVRRSAALALVTVATALGFLQVFATRDFLPVLLAVALLPHLAGAWGRARGWSTGRVALLGAGGSALVLVWATAGATTAYGIPTGATVSRIGHLLDGGWHVFRVGVPPVPARDGVVLLAALAVAIVAVSSEVIVRRTDVTLGALAPSLVLFVLTGTLGSDRRSVALTVVYLVAVLVALVVLNGERVAARRTWFTGRRLASEGATMRAAAAVGGAAVLAAVVLTPLVPGTGSDPLLRYRGGSGTGAGGGFGDYAGINPLVDLRARLAERSDVELFRVDADAPAYWRLLALDRFDGTTWSIATSAEPAAEALDPPARGTTVRQRFRITALADQWMPAAFSPVSTTNGNARVIPESQTLVAPGPIVDSLYDVESRVPAPPTGRQIARTDRRVPDDLRRYLELPDGFPARLRARAAEITASAATPWDRAVVLQQFFTGGDFEYTLDVRLGDDTDAMVQFLERRRGFCQQFAATYAALARAVGLPSRVAVGFTPGTKLTQDGDYVVRGRDAHAWVEVWFPGLGWRTFEPTPAGGLPGQAVDTEVAAIPGATATTSPTTTSSATTAPGTPADDAAARVPRDPRVSTSSGGGDGGVDVRTVALTTIAVGVVAVLVARLVTWLLRPRRRRRRRRRAPTSASRIAGAWREALDTCRAAGHPVSDALTPAEQVRSLRRHGLPDEAAPALEELACLYADAEYAPATPPATAEHDAWAAVATLRRALVEERGPRERLRQVVGAGRD